MKTLTAEDLDFIKKDAEAKRKNTRSPIDELIQTAYDYGRRVKPLVWTRDISMEFDNCLMYFGSSGMVEYEVIKWLGQGWGAHASDRDTSFHATEKEAKHACQKHHNELILGALE